MKQENYFTANQDLQFQFKHNTPWAELSTLAERNFTDPEGPADADEANAIYWEALTLAGEYAGHDIAGRARAVDEAGSWHGSGPIELSAPLRENLDGLTKLGLIGAGIPRRYGGKAFLSPPPPCCSRFSLAPMQAPWCSTPFT